MLVDELLASGRKLPEMYIAIGTEDFLLGNNRVFHDFMVSRGVSHTYEESAGSHDMAFWDEWTRRFIPMLFEGEE